MQVGNFIFGVLTFAFVPVVAVAQSPQQPDIRVSHLPGPTIVAATRPLPKPYDISRMLDDLGQAGTYERGLSALRAAPPQAIVPIQDAIQDLRLEPSVRQDLKNNLESIYNSARATRRAEDRERWRIWTRQTGRDICLQSARAVSWESTVQKAFDLVDADAEAARQLFKAAIDTGCRDPYVRSVYLSLAMKSSEVPAGPGTLLWNDVVRDMNQSLYPDARRFVADLEFLSWAIKDTCPPEITEKRKVAVLDEAFNLLPSFLASHPPRSILRSCVAQFEGISERNRLREIILPSIYGVLNAHIPDDPYTYYLAAEFNRVMTYSPYNTPEENGHSAERREMARNFAETGWRVDPLSVDCALFMAQFNMGADLTIFDQWFQRAILADPDCYDAFACKLGLLESRQSESELLDFGDECLRRGTPMNRIATILLQVHSVISRKYDSQQYYARDNVWEDIRSVYRNLLQDPAGLRTRRSVVLRDRAAFVRAACDCNRWKDAALLMKEFGNELDIDALGGQAMYDYLRRKAESSAQ